MKRLILGTAGHIDHGKTALIKTLTGIDTDRLKEEKERGITIELGFAYLDLPSGERLGIIDVPGHEKFIKNMVSGSGGIDITALIVAADEGIMPQTIEHMNILKLLGIHLGLIVITKIDLVEPDFCDLVEEEITDFVKGTFLEGSPIVRVSSVTGHGIDELISVLDDMVSKVEGRMTSGIFRLPVDRVFTMKGFGTVITGTLQSGGVKTGEEVEISPRGTVAKIRGIQIHGSKKDEALAGTRTAINLSGIDKDRIMRGDVLISPGALEPSYMIDARFTYLSDAPKNLKNRVRVRLHIGTSEVESNVILLDKEEITPGEEAFVQIRLTEPVLALPGDRFVIRSLSPTYTIGGGEILRSHPKKHKRFKEETIKDFETLILGNLEDKAVVFLKDAGYFGVALSELGKRMAASDDETRKILDELVKDGIAVPIDKDRYIDGESYGRLHTIVTKLTEDYHAKNPTGGGIPKEELLGKMPWGVVSKTLMKLIDDLVGDDKIVIIKDKIALKGHKVVLGKKDEEVLNSALELIGKAHLSPPSTQEISEALSFPDAEIKKLLAWASGDGKIIRVKENLYFDAKAIGEIKEKLISYLKENGEIDTQKMKEMTGATRKYTIPLLEYFDGEKVTIRIGDVRRLRERGGG